MAAAGVATARSGVGEDMAAALRALHNFSLPVVVKADGLAAGKGVVICPTRDEAIRALSAMLEDRVLGNAGNAVVIEEFLEGDEVSIFGLTDGETVTSLVPARDYKRATDGDSGPNTGGMGAFAPVPAVTAEITEQIRVEMRDPVLSELRNRDARFQGVLYAGLMLTAAGPRGIEFNCRFGDPETQVVLPLMDGDLAEIAMAVAQGRLGDVPAPKVRPDAAVGVVLASGGYPGPYQTGFPITGVDTVPEDVIVFHAGTKRNESGEIVTAGGRVLVVVGQGSDWQAARARAYAGVDAIHFARRHYRKDIALAI
jgi:phosphoribosylamine--glycine ligase